MEPPGLAAVPAVAVAADNEAWRLLDDHEPVGAAGLLSGEWAEHLLPAAHASLWAGSELGRPAHRGRAHHQVSRSSAGTGDARLALGHAERYASLIEQQPADFADFNSALVLQARARALACARRLEEATAVRSETQRLSAAVTDPKVRGVVFERLESGPWFGLAPSRR